MDHRSENTTEWVAIPQEDADGHPIDNDIYPVDTIEEARDALRALYEKDLESAIIYRGKIDDDLRVDTGKILISEFATPTIAEQVLARLPHELSSPRIFYAASI